ncbi:unnamed protein product [Cylicostephanus goldi]|uniref:DNA mismatch repair proteins mutS family domain-containing protein n=1 Tax=Cylicostephanus goldi TaxID=71465 RepID=A0A3P7M6S1_CYLGO|nr:unnamed protein product [Cylicostephanus goldi]
MSSLILSRSSLLFGIERAGALLDAAISLALTARQFGWNRPKFVDEPIIDAVRVVHPLSQLVTEHFVPNPIRLFLVSLEEFEDPSCSSGGDYSKIKIFTGPNACGKSVYLKQVGVLVFLAHIGSFVPAEVAHIGIVNRILSRIYTIDAALDGLSTFAKDLDQTMEVMKKGVELNFQYHLVDGLVDSSYAAYTASKMGVAQDVVDRANKIYEFIRGGHALSDMTSLDTGEDVRNQWLLDAMVELQPQFEEWDIRADVDSLLEMLEKYIFEADEKIQQDMSQESDSTSDGQRMENEVARATEDDEEGDADSQLDKEEVEQSTVSEDENIKSHQDADGTIPDMPPSAMCNKSKSKDKSNLSVSFALDMVETGAAAAPTTVASDSENVEDIKR